MRNGFKDSIACGVSIHKRDLQFDAFVISRYHLSVMLDQLPEYIDPVHLADKRGELHGEIPLASLTRLASILENCEGMVAVKLVFSREGRLAKIEGQVTTCLKLKCQNCLSAVDWAVSSQISLGIVSSVEQMGRLPDGYEPLLIGAGKVILKDIVEDELMLIIPEYPKHEYDCFSLNLANKASASIISNDESSPESPFSVLAKLKI